MCKLQVDKKAYGELNDGRTVDSYTLRNDSGVSISILTYGGIVHSLKVPDRFGQIKNIVLRYNDLNGYVNDTKFIGCIVGRCANRIENGRFKLNHKTHYLTKNMLNDHIHGGHKGFHKRLWHATSVKDKDRVSLVLSYRSRDMEEGYPGNVHVTVTYSLIQDQKWCIDYHAVTDEETVVNLTQHSYFNLSGNRGDDCLSHRISIQANQFTPLNQRLIPIGCLQSVRNTPLELLDPIKIGERMDYSFEPIHTAGGFDQNFVFDKERNSDEPVAYLEEPKSGRIMKVYTTQPCIQFYTGNSLDQKSTDKIRSTFKRYQALCLETQGFPNAPNHKHFPSVFLKPKEIYQHQTIYEFSTV